MKAISRQLNGIRSELKEPLHEATAEIRNKK